MLFNRVDQLGDVDGLGQKWMALDIETPVYLVSVHQRHKKDYRRVLQFMISVDSRCYFAFVCLWHHNRKQD
jgi:hypothetical protein